MKTVSHPSSVRVNLRDRYLPKRFTELVACEIPARFAARWLSSGQIPKGILVTGDMGCGKSLFAQLLAKAAACQDRPKGGFEPCGVCRSCRGMAVFESLSRIGSEVETDEFISEIRNIRSGGGGTMFDEGGEWFPVVLDEIHELPKPAQKRLRSEFDGEWNKSFLVATTNKPEDMDEPLRDRLQPIHLTPPMRSESMQWVARICKEVSISVESKEAIGAVVDACTGRYRAILNLLQQFHDLELPLTVSAVRQMSGMG